MRSRIVISFICFLSLLSVDRISAETVKVTYAQTSKTEISCTDDATAPDNVSASFSTTYPNNSSVQLTEGYSMTYTFSGFDGYTIHGITLNMKSNTRTGAGSLSIKVGDEVIASIAESGFDSWYGSYSTAYVDVVPKVTNTKVGLGEDLVIAISSTENSLYCKSVTIEYSVASKLPSPTLPASAVFDDSYEIVITDIPDGAIVRYTTDGTEPSMENGNIYAAPFSIDVTTTLKAVAVLEGVVSDVVTATYTKAPSSFTIALNVNGQTTNMTWPRGVLLDEQSILPVSLPSGLLVSGWALDANASEMATFPLDVYSDMMLYAVLSSSGLSEPVLYDAYVLVNDVADLKAGDSVIIAENNDGVAISKDGLNSKNKYALPTTVEINGDMLTPSTDTRVFVLGKSGDDYTFVENSKYLAYNRSGTELLMSDGEDSWSITVENGLASIESNFDIARYLKYSTLNTRFAAYSASTASYRLPSIYKKKVINTLFTSYTPINITSAGYATMYLDTPVVIPKELEAYIITGVVETELVMQQVKGVLPARTGVVLRAPAGVYGLLHVHEALAEEMEGNLLSGTATDTCITAQKGYAYYVLARKNGLVAMYHPTLTDGQFLNNANRAYLALDLSNFGIFDEDIDTGDDGIQLSNGLRFNFSGTTDIALQPSTISPQPSPLIYDLQGRRVYTLNSAGVYIVNGQKIIYKP